MQNYVQPGDILTVAAPAAVVAGALVAVGKIIGVAVTSVAIGADVAIVVEGVVEVAKVAADNVAAGDALYYVAATNNLTNVAGTGSKPLAGVAVKAAAAATTTVRAKLCGWGVIGPA